MSEFYDRDGTPIDFRAWGEKTKDRAYKRVAETTLPDGKWVSTVWLGLDHGFGSGPPLIFETMVFSSKHDMGGDVDCDRYATEADAIAGHQRMVEQWSQVEEAR